MKTYVDSVLFSFDVLIIIIIAVVFFLFPESVRKFSFAWQSQTELKLSILAIIGILIWRSFSLGNKILQPKDLSIAKLFYEWPDYKQFKATVYTGIFQCVISGIVYFLSLILAQNDNWFLFITITSFLLAAISFVSLYWAEQRINEIFTKNSQ